MKKTEEGSVRSKAVLIYAVVTLVFIGTIAYMYKLREGITAQKQAIARNNQTLSKTNQLISTIQDAQSAANLYALSGSKRHLLRFQKLAKVAEEQMGLLSKSNADTVAERMLGDISSLLHKKEEIVSRLSKTLGDTSTTLTEIEKQLQRIAEEPKGDSLVVSTIRQHVLVDQAPTKTFWRRLGDVFSPKKQDSTIKITTTKVDTIQRESATVAPLISEVQQMTDDMSKQLSDRMKSIERNITLVLKSDQEISSQLSDMMYRLHRQTLESVQQQLERSAILYQRSYHLTIATAVASLLIILFFIYLIINDVNKGSASRKALEREKRYSEVLMESRHQLLLSVSHDIKAPLSSIIGHLDLLKEDKKTPSEKRRIDSMQSSGRHILTLLANLLEFSSLEKGSLTVNTTSFDANELLQEIAEMFHPLALQKGLTFSGIINFPDKQMLVADRTKIQQILGNLISNAIKYTTSGGVTFKSWYEHGYLYFTVEDTGIGIPSSKLADIFKPFTRIDRTREVAEGNGFGLFVVKGLVDMLGGILEVHSVVNEGTKMGVKIPVEAGEPTTDKQEGTTQLTPSLNGLRMLVVDDDLAMLSMINEMISRMHHMVTTCNTLKELTDRLVHDPLYDIVITDMDLQTFTGYDVLAKVKEASSSTKVIVITASSRFSLQLALENGFDGYLPKPFTKRELASTLNTAYTTPIADSKAPSQDELEMLLEMLDGDTDALREVVETFCEATLSNIQELRQAITDEHFAKAQSICHRMLPMFNQLGPQQIVQPLQQMDELRGKPASSHPQWKVDLSLFIVEALQMVSRLKSSVVR